jgi:hypothetical protein
MTDDHNEIWLECKCGDFSYEGRQWCGHDVFECSDHGPECKGSVKYIRADLHDALRAENERLQRERDEARAKAIDEAAAICRAQTEGIDIEEGDWHAGWTQCAEACADEILARIHGYE